MHAHYLRDDTPFFNLSEGWDFSFAFLSVYDYLFKLLGALTCLIYVEIRYYSSLLFLSAYLSLNLMEVYSLTACMTL